MPVTVDWSGIVVPPAEGTTETTLVLCKSEDGEPVALRLGNGARHSLALKLIDPTGASGHIARIAFLRREIGKMEPGTHLNARRAARLLTKAGYPAFKPESEARRDLAELHRQGLLDQHEECDVRWYSVTPQQQAVTQWARTTTP
ncbi:hypothetical protein [Streptomyces mirabilis]|uniref:hypothetical protein n=1 Tax=Streptomyces mirabilis TaxID=68239 RepID=UPI0036B275AE